MIAQPSTNPVQVQPSKQEITQHLEILISKLNQIPTKQFHQDLYLDYVSHILHFPQESAQQTSINQKNYTENVINATLRQLVENATTFKIVDHFCDKYINKGYISIEFVIEKCISKYILHDLPKQIPNKMPDNGVMKYFLCKEIFSKEEDSRGKELIFKSCRNSQRISKNMLEIANKYLLNKHKQSKSKENTIQSDYTQILLFAIQIIENNQKVNEGLVEEALKSVYIMFIKEQQQFMNILIENVELIYKIVALCTNKRPSGQALFIIANMIQKLIIAKHTIIVKDKINSQQNTGSMNDQKSKVFMNDENNRTKRRSLTKKDIKQIIERIIMHLRSQTIAQNADLSLEIKKIKHGVPTSEQQKHIMLLRGISYFLLIANKYSHAHKTSQNHAHKTYQNDRQKAQESHTDTSLQGLDGVIKIGRQLTYQLLRIEDLVTYDNTITNLYLHYKDEIINGKQEDKAMLYKSICQNTLPYIQYQPQSVQSHQQQEDIQKQQHQQEDIQKQQHQQEDIQKQQHQQEDIHQQMSYAMLDIASESYQTTSEACKAQSFLLKQYFMQKYSQQINNKSFPVEIDQIIHSKIQKQYDQLFNVHQFATACNLLHHTIRILMAHGEQMKEQKQTKQNGFKSNLMRDYCNLKELMLNYIKWLLNLNECCMLENRGIINNKIFDLILAYPIILNSNPFLQEVVQNQLIYRFPNNLSNLKSLIQYYKNNKKNVFLLGPDRMELLKYNKEDKKAREMLMQKQYANMLERMADKILRRLTDLDLSAHDRVNLWKILLTLYQGAANFNELKQIYQGRERQFIAKFIAMKQLHVNCQEDHTKIQEIYLRISQIPVLYDQEIKILSSLMDKESTA